MAMNLSTSLEVASASDPGMVRSHNEDSVSTDVRHGLGVLADGMGGYNAGEIASGMATPVIVSELQGLLEWFEPHEVHGKSGDKYAALLLREQVAKASTSIYQAAQSQPQYA